MSIFIGDKEITMAYLGDLPLETSTSGYYSSIYIDYLIVGGGGQGGADNGGGGGAGGFVTGSQSISKSDYTIIVGDGGSGSISQGYPSYFLSYTAYGGGGGGSNQYTGSDGASGGGGGGSIAPPFCGYISGGLSISGQGNIGGDGYTCQGTSPYVYGPGGGGGAGEPGQTASTSSYIRANGGSGSQWLDGNWYAGGGGAAGVVGYPTGGLGGFGGGGDGAPTSYDLGEEGLPNTGGGGGGGGIAPLSPAAGGSGIVVVRYEGPQIATGGDNIYTSGSYTYHEFKTVGTGSLSFNPYGGVLVYQSGSLGLVASYDSIPVTSYGTYPAEYNVWGCLGTLIGTSAAVGDAASNQSAILSGCGTRPIFASIVDSFTSHGYSDWYVPTKDELTAIRNYQLANGNLPNSPIGPTVFWASSTEGGTPEDQYWAGDDELVLFDYRVKQGDVGSTTWIRPIRYITL